MPMMWGSPASKDKSAEPDSPGLELQLRSTMTGAELDTDLVLQSGWMVSTWGRSWR